MLRVTEQMISCLASHGQMWCLSNNYQHILPLRCMESRHLPIYPVPTLPAPKDAMPSCACSRPACGPSPTVVSSHSYGETSAASSLADVSIACVPSWARACVCASGGIALALDAGSCPGATSPFPLECLHCSSRDSSSWQRDSASCRFLRVNGVLDGRCGNVHSLRDFSQYSHGWSAARGTHLVFRFWHCRHARSDKAARWDLLGGIVVIAG